MSAPTSKPNLPLDDTDRDAVQPSGHPKADDGVLDSIGKAITAPIRDDPGTNVDEKPEDPPGSRAPLRP